MSKYKTPIRIHLDTTRKINQKTTKYRLPFQKEQTSRQPKHKLESGYMIDSQQIKTDYFHQKGSLIEKASRKREPQTNNQQPESVLQKYQEKQVISQLQAQSVIVNPAAPTIQKQEHQTQAIYKQQVIQTKQVQKQNQQTQVQALLKEQSQIKRVESKLAIGRSHQFKLQSIPSKVDPLQLKLEPIQSRNTSFYKRSDHSLVEKRIKHHSSSNRYGDQDNYADGSRYSQIDSSTFLNTNSKGMPKITRKSKEAKPMHQSIKKVEREVWQILSQCTQKQEMNQLSKYHKRSKSKVKRSQSKLPESQLKHQSKIMLQKLKDLNDKTEEQMISNTNQDMYNQLPPINEDSQVSYLSKEEHDSIIQKLHSLLELKRSSKKNKEVVPLEKYHKQYALISKINPFFKKLNQFGGCILLSIGKIKFMNTGDLIFTEGQPISHVSIIILGKVLQTKSFSQYKKIVLPGESLGQQVLFDQSKPYHLRLSNSSKSIFYRAQARAHTKVCILRINLRRFYKMSIELNSIGEKRLFNLIDNLFKINYLKKNALLHQQLKQRLQTEILVTRRKRKGSFYFH